MLRRAVGLVMRFVLALACGVGALRAWGQDLLVAGDGAHLWLVVESAGEDGEQIEVYHRAADDDHGRMQALEPIPGRLRPGGIAAGGGWLLLVLDNGHVLTRRPYKEPMGWGWSYRPGTIERLPDGCALRSLAANERGVWALVRVDQPEALAALDAEPAQGARRGGHDRLNSAIGLPRGIDLPGRGADDSTEQGGGGGGDDPAAEDDPPNDANATGAADPPPGGVVPDAALTETPGRPDPDGAEERSSDPAPAVSEPTFDPTADSAQAVPVYRLIRLGGRGWRSVPLPEGFGLPTRAALVLRGARDHRPAIVSDAPRGVGEFILTLPTGEDDWAQRTYYLPGRRGWSASAVSGQVYVAVERERDAKQVVVDVYLLRGRRRSNAAVMWVNTLATPRWRFLGQGDEAVLLARPDAPPSGRDAPENPVLLTLLLGEYRMSGDLLGSLPDEDGRGPLPGLHTDYYPAKRSRWESNADWLIQIITLTLAMTILMLFWKRTPRNREVWLPDHVHLVPWSRRLLSTLIDLMPGLWIAGAVYGLGWDEIVLRYWPGTPIAKPPEAMGPGWLVIGITVFHTTVFEFITARSIGKWFTGIYVSDFRGVPAPPGASLVRALTRVFELVAWLLLLLPLISPHRQRLGDILAKTLVVYRDPPPEEKDAEDGDDA